MIEPASPHSKPLPDGKGDRVGRRQDRGAKAYRQGHGAEWIVAFYLMLKGYQILGFRLKTKAGEIDILARKGRLLVVVEVKLRLSRDQALQSVVPEQYNRLLKAGNAVMKHKPSLLGLDLRIDLVAMAPGRWPYHLKGLICTREPHDAG